MPDLKAGTETSEHAMAKKTQWLAVASMILGAIVAAGPGLLEGMAKDSTAYVIVGGVVMIAGKITHYLSSSAYGKQRADLKK